MALFLGTPKVESRNCPEIVPVWTPGALRNHISRLPSPIGARSKSMLYLSLRAFQRHVTHCHRTSGRGQFPTFNGP
jgi:hypothetical protein